MRLSRFAVCVLVGVALCGCEDKITAENLALITPGMTMDQVVTILGEGERQELQGMSISAAGLAGGAASNSQTTYVWKGKGKEISVTFKDGKVVTTGRSGL
jgi:hypothetical protein